MPGISRLIGSGTPGISKLVSTPYQPLLAKKVPVTRRAISNYNNVISSTSGTKRDFFTELSDQFIFNCSDLEYIVSPKVSSTANVIGEIPMTAALTSLKCGIRRVVQGPITVVSSTNVTNAVITIGADLIANTNYSSATGANTAAGRVFIVTKFDVTSGFYNSVTPENLVITSNTATTITTSGVFASAAGAGDIIYITEVSLGIDATGGISPALATTGGTLRMRVPGVSGKDTDPCWHRFYGVVGSDTPVMQGSWFAPWAAPYAGTVYTQPHDVYADTCVDSTTTTADIIKSGVTSTTSLSWAAGTCAPTARLLVGTVKNRTRASFMMLGDSRLQQLSESDGFHQFAGSGDNPYQVMDMTLFGYQMNKQRIPRVRASRSGESLASILGAGAQERQELMEYVDYVIVQPCINDITGGASAELIIAETKRLCDEIHSKRRKVIGVVPYPYTADGTGGNGTMYCSPASQTVVNAGYEAVRQTLISWQTGTGTYASTGAVATGYYDYVIDPRAWTEETSGGSYTGIWKAAAVITTLTLGTSVFSGSNLRLVTATDTRNYAPRMTAIYVPTDSTWLWGRGRYLGISNWSSTQLVITTNTTYGSKNTLTTSDATNATPIVVTTTTSHGLTDGELVAITGITGNTAANVNTAYVKSTAATTFELYSDAGLTAGVAGNGAYGGTGTVYPVPPASATVQLLAGYATIAATGIHHAFQACLDAVNYVDFTSYPVLYE